MIVQLVLALNLYRKGHGLLTPVRSKFGKLSLEIPLIHSKYCDHLVISMWAALPRKISREKCLRAILISYRTLLTVIFTIFTFIGTLFF